MKMPFEVVNLSINQFNSVLILTNIQVLKIQDKIYV